MIGHPHCMTVDDAARGWRDPDVPQQVGFPLYAESAAGGTRGAWRVTEDVKRTLPATFNTRSR